MKRFLGSALALACLLCTAIGAQEQQQDQPAPETRPVVVASISSYAELESDIQFLGEIADAPQLAEQLEGALMHFTQGQGLAGLDKEKPLGAALLMDETGMMYQTLVFVPVTDLEALLAALATALGEPEDAGDGVWRVNAQGQTLHVKEQKGWAFIAQSPGHLENLPADPMEILGDLPEQYDVSVRANIQNIPQAYRETAVALLQQGAMMGMQQMPDESDEQYAIRSQMTQMQIDALATAINDLDELTFGWAIDAPGKRTYLDFVVNVVEGSESARSLGLEVPESKLAGFMLQDAVLNMHVNGAIAEADIANFTTMIDGLRDQVMQELENEQELDDPEVKEAVKQIVADAMDVLEATVKEGHSNGGAMVVGSGPFTAVLGSYVADGAKLEKAVRKLVDLAAEEEGFPEVKFDVARHKNVRFHTATFEYPDSPESEAAQQLLGEDLVLVMGFGPKVVYAAVGPKGIDTIKQVIDASASSAQAELPPFQMQISLAPILKYASEQPGSDPQLAVIAEELGETSKDHVIITSTEVPLGARVRIEAQEGVLQVIGSKAKQAAAASGVGSL